MIETRLTVISPLSLGGQRVLSLLVLSDLVGGVLLADLSLAVYSSVLHLHLSQRKTYRFVESCKAVVSIHPILFPSREWVCELDILRTIIVS